MVTDRVGPTITTLKAEVDYLDGEVKKLLNLLADARTESMKLRAALERIASLDVPRPIGHTFRADGVASKHDKCWHGETMYDECAACLSNYARAALEGK